MGIPKGYVEAYGSRSGFVYPCDGKIHWAHSVTLHLLAAQRVTRSRRWNITGTSKAGLVGNEIELGIMIPLIRSRTSLVSKRQRELGIDVKVHTTSFVECTGGHYG